MRTAGKRPKALRARRIRPQDRRFVPVLMDRSPPARQPAPRSDLPLPPLASVQASCGDFQETLPASSQPGHLQKIFFNPSGHSLARHTPLQPCKRRVQTTSKRAFPSRPDTTAPPPRIEPRLPLSSPLVKQRGAAPPASCRQAPHELRPCPNDKFHKTPSPSGNAQARSTIPANIKISSQQDRQWSHARGPMRSGMPGYGRRTGAAAPPGTVALGRLTARKSPCTDQNKSFRGDGGPGEGEPFPKGTPSPGRPTFLQ